MKLGCNDKKCTQNICGKKLLEVGNLRLKLDAKTLTLKLRGWEADRSSSNIRL
jgi:hypothetical protein